MVVSGQAFSAEAEKCLQGPERHLGVSGCLLRREPCRHCACALHPHLRAHVEKLGRIERRCSTSRVAVASSQGEKDFGFFFSFSGLRASRRTFHCEERRLVSWSVRDMELKKSISDTERVLRSYGAVSETAWTTDKGERVPHRHTTPLEPETSWRRSPEGLESGEMVKRWLTRVRRVLISLMLKGRLINSSTCTAWR